MSRKKKSLTIGNTDQYLNFHLIKSDTVSDKIKVTKMNEKQIEEEMDDLEKRSRRIPLRDDKEYIIYQELYTNDTLIEKIIKHGGKVTYYTNTIAPYYVIKQLANHLDSEIVYKVRDTFTPEEITNIELAYMATKVIIDVPVVVPDISPYDILFSLHCLKTNVDRVYLSFPPLRENEVGNRTSLYTKREDNLYELDPYTKYEFTQKVRASLSIWKMYLYLLANNETDKQHIQVHLDRYIKTRSSGQGKKGDN